MDPQHILFRSQNVWLAGSLVVPEHNGINAAVLCVTGGGDKDSDHYYLEWQQYLAEQLGVVSLAFSARGVDRSGGHFRTNSKGYRKGSPVNSQESRSLDTVQAFRFLHQEVNGVDLDRIGIIGGSMGGDIALHAIDKLPAAALLLRAPAAYPDGLHPAKYGPQWRRKHARLGGNEAALKSHNFELVRRMTLPLMLVYSNGDRIIPPSIQNQYIDAVRKAYGFVHLVGDEQTGHDYLNAQIDPSQARPEDTQAKLDTFAASAEFFGKYLEVA